jgi:hypothetical protein
LPHIGRFFRSIILCGTRLVRRRSAHRQRAMSLHRQCRLCCFDRCTTSFSSINELNIHAVTALLESRSSVKQFWIEGGRSE